MGKVKVLLAAGVLLALSVPLNGVETGFWQMGSFDDFLRGTLNDVSLSRDGELTLAPETRSVFSPEQNLALALVGDHKGNLYIGTGHEGKVFRVDAAGKGSLFFTASQPDVFALAVGHDGDLYVGSSPDGKIYRVTPDGKSSVFYETKTKYVWALAFDAQGRLYAGTGDQGKILRIDRDGKGSVFYETNQTHVMCLTFDAKGNLLAGTDPNGLIYRLTPEGKAFVLYQASLPEIHALATDSEGRIYAAALGGAGSKGSPGILLQGSPGIEPPLVTTVTVTASTGDLPAAQSPPGANPEPSQEQQHPEKAGVSPSFNRPPQTGIQFPPPRMPQGKGALIAIDPDSTVETIWNSNNESIFGLAVRGQQVLFSTDQNGRIFELMASRQGEQLTLLAETREALATRLWLEGQQVFAATTNVAKLFRLGATPSASGNYESPVKDAKFISHWGRIAWRADTPAGTGLEFYTRSGNTGRPDSTWSDWSGPYRDSNGMPIQSPTGRYIQWKAVFHANGQVSPVLDDVTVSYLNQNLPPQIRSLSVSNSSERTSPAAGSGGSAGTFSGATINVMGGTSTNFGVPAPGGTGNGPVTLTWQADDPNGDTLTYTLYVKSADEQQWHLLKDNIRQNSYAIEPDTLADGKYVARLVASDGESNPAGEADQTEMVSAPFWIDDTPPAVRLVAQRATARGATLQFEAEDSTSPLRRAEVSTDGKEWHQIISDDGIVDAQRETFTVKIEKLDPGEHVVTLRAYDTAGNAGVGKAVVRVSESGQ